MFESTFEVIGIKSSSEQSQIRYLQALVKMKNQRIASLKRELAVTSMNKELINIEVRDAIHAVQKLKNFSGKTISQPSVWQKFKSFFKRSSLNAAVHN